MLTLAKGTLELILNGKEDSVNISCFQEAADTEAKKWF